MMIFILTCKIDFAFFFFSKKMCINLEKINSFEWQVKNGNLETEINSIKYICDYENKTWKLTPLDNNLYSNIKFLCFQAIRDDIYIFAKLILEHFKVNAQYDIQYPDNTYLLCACFHNRNEIAKLILDLEICDINKQHINDKNTALLVSVFNKNIELIKMLLIKNANVNIQNNIGDTALIIASNHKNIEIVKLLLEHNCDVNIQNKDGNTALIYASSPGNIEIVKLLLEHNCNVNMKDKFLNNALLYATYINNYKIVELLLTNESINVNAKNSEKKTVLTISSSFKDKKIFNLISNDKRLKQTNDTCTIF